MKSIMKVLLCDGPVVLELADDPLLATALLWKIKFAVTDVLFEHELRTPDAGKRERCAYRVESLAPEALCRALELRRLHGRLSLGDACALALAAERSWVLLTANPTLARIAAEAAVESRDIEWLRAETLLLEQLAPHEDARRFGPAIKDDRDAYRSLEHSSV